jgi:hypothetical protein
MHRFKPRPKPDTRRVHRLPAVTAPQTVPDCNRPLTHYVSPGGNPPKAFRSSTAKWLTATHVKGGRA